MDVNSPAYNFEANSFTIGAAFYISASKADPVSKKVQSIYESIDLSELITFSAYSLSYIEGELSIKDLILIPCENNDPNLAFIFKNARCVQKDHTFI